MKGKSYLRNSYTEFAHVCEVGKHKWFNRILYCGRVSAVVPSQYTCEEKYLWVTDTLLYSEVVIFKNCTESYKYPTQLLHRPRIWLRFQAHPLNSPGEWDRDERLGRSLVLNQQPHSGQLDFWSILLCLILKPWNLNGIFFKRMI